MADKLTCGIVRDLLPSYVDGLTCEETNAALREHMNDCAECTAVYERMKEPENGLSADNPDKEVDFLKKVRRRSQRIVAAIVCVALLLCSALGVYIVLKNRVDYGVTLDNCYAAEYAECWTEDGGFVIPDGVKTIGEGAFRNSHLTYVVMPDSITYILDNAFMNSNLVELTIPSGVVSIGNSAFECCSLLESIVIPKNVRTIGDRAFAECGSLTSVKIAGRVIGEYAFENCLWLKCVELEKGVTGIGEFAFRNCVNLSEIKLPDTLRIIGDGAFAECLNLTVECADNKRFYTEDGVLFSEKGTLIYYPSTKPDASYAIPEGTKRIADSAFLCCDNVTGISIPDSVTYIGNSAFRMCLNIPEFVIPASVTHIGEGAFSQCRSNSVDLSNNSNFSYDGTAIVTADGVLIYCEANVSGTYRLPDGVVRVGEYVFDGCEGLREVVINPELTSIGRWAFAHCDGLKEFDIPDSVTELGEHAFDDCSSLRRVSIGTGLTEIPTAAFIYCAELNQLELSKGLVSIGTNAFWESGIYLFVELPDSVRVIGNGAFYECTVVAPYEEYVYGDFPLSGGEWIVE